MRNLLSSTAALLLLSSGAYAADLGNRPPPAPAPMMAAPANWTGGYVGIGAGVTSFSTDFGTPLTSDINGTLPFDILTNDWAGHRKISGTGTLYAGYNFQNGAGVYGLELSGNIYSITNKVQITPLGNLPGVSGVTINQADLKAKLTWTAALKARLGLAFGNTLAYVGVGPVLAGIKTSINGDWTITQDEQTLPLQVSGSTSSAKVGLALAGGVDHMVSQNLVLRLQAEYFAFPRVTLNSDPVSSNNNQQFPLTQRSSVVNATLGLAYKF